MTGTLPVANGGTGTATAFTAGSVVFAGASGTYSQNNTKFFWDNTNNRLGINTGSPQTQLTIVSNTQTTTPTGTLPSGTDIYIVGANAANTRITQDAYGTGAYGVYTARSARGTAASPTASQSGDILSQFTGRGYGATGFAAASTGRFDVTAAENFTDTAQGTYASVFVTAIGANSSTEAFRFGTAGQLGIGGATYGTSGYVLTSGGASAAPTWSQVSATSLSGILPVANGGTGLASWTTGSLVYASGTTTLAGLADVATGNVLLSGGVGVAPAWGQVSLTTAVTGTLPIANGGTGLTSTPANGALDIGNGAGFTRTTLTQGTNIAITNGSGSISIATSATPSFATSVTTPLVIGGTAASSSLTLQSTSGIGTSDSILFKVGNNGATTAMSIATGGTVTIGTLNLTNALGVGYGGTGLTTTPANGALDIGNGTGFTRTTLTAGTNIAITNGAGSISIATSATPSFATSVTTPLVIGGTAASSSLTLQSTSGVGTSDSILFKVGNNGATTAMTVDTSGNVGIGTSSPGTQFNVYKSTATQVAIRPQNSLAYADFGPISDGTVYGPYAAPAASTGLIVGTSNSNPVQLWTNGAERMRVDATGNVNVGSSAPVNPASLSILKQTTALSGTTNSFGIYLYPTSSGLCYIDAITSTSGNSSLTLRTYNNGTYSSVNMDSTGNLNIATSGVSAKLYVNGNSASNIYALTDGATITPDFSTGNNFSVTLAGNRTLANPTNMTVGQSGIIYVSQDATGSRTLAYGTYWKFPGGAAAVLTTTASATDALVYTVRTSTSITVTPIYNIG